MSADVLSGGYTEPKRFYGLRNRCGNQAGTVTRSLRLDGGDAHDLRPPRPFLGDNRRELLQRRDPRLDPELGDDGERLGRLQAFADRAARTPRRITAP
jgi:hypothetical protein